MANTPILIVDFATEGHHALHVCHLVRFGMTQAHTDIRFLLPRDLRDAVERQLPPAEAAFFVSRLHILEDHATWIRVVSWVRNKRIAQLIFVEYLNRRVGNNVLLLFLFFESVIYQVALSPLPRRNIAGVMFRPTFHYRARGMLQLRLRSHLLFATKYVVAFLLAKRPGITRVFLLDPLAEDYAHSKWASYKFTLVPDPVGPAPGAVRPYGASEPVRDRPLNLLIAGALAPRKGIHWAADALLKCSENSRCNVRLFLVGKPEAGFSDYVANNIERLKASGVLVSGELRFVSDSELDDYISRAHLVLTPYVGFTGSSGIIIRAAHFGKPVLSSNDGLLGYLVEKHNLGEAIDVTDIEIFSRWLESFISSGRVTGFDPSSARAFADSCDPERYARALLS